MISLFEIAKSINEVDDDKIIKYKDKDGESQEMTAGAAKKMDKDHPAKQAWDKMNSQEKGGDEKNAGGKLGGSDFDRDGGDDKPDMDSDDGNEKIEKGVKKDINQLRDKIQSGEARADDLRKVAKDIDRKYGEDKIDNAFELNDLAYDVQSLGINYMKDEVISILNKLESELAQNEPLPVGKQKPEPKPNPEKDDVEISDSNSGPIDRDEIMDMLKDDPEIMDLIGTGDDDDLYWDGVDLVSSKMDDQTVASIDPDSNMTLGDLKQQIRDFEYEEEDDPEKVSQFYGDPGEDPNEPTHAEIMQYIEDEGYGGDAIGPDGNPTPEAYEDAKQELMYQKQNETITINGQKYKPIKEEKKKSNPRVLKENYDRIFRSLK